MTYVNSRMINEIDVVLGTLKGEAKVKFLQSIAEFLHTLWVTFTNVLSFSLGVDTFDFPDEYRWAVPITIAVIGGISVMLGHGVILAINRVKRHRTILTLVGSGLLAVLTALLETCLIWVMANPVVQRPLSILEMAPLVLLSYAPYAFGFLISLPYSGPGVAVILQVWHMVALWTVLYNYLDVGMLTPLVIAFATMLAVSAMDYVVNESRLKLRERFFRFVSNSEWLSSRDLMRAGVRKDQS